MTRGAEENAAAAANAAAANGRETTAAEKLAARRNSARRSLRGGKVAGSRGAMTRIPLGGMRNSGGSGGALAEAGAWERDEQEKQTAALVEAPRTARAETPPRNPLGERPGAPTMGQHEQPQPQPPQKSEHEALENRCEQNRPEKSGIINKVKAEVDRDAGQDLGLVEEKKPKTKTKESGGGGGSSSSKSAPRRRRERAKTSGAGASTARAPATGLHLMSARTPSTQAVHAFVNDPQARWKAAMLSVGVLVLVVVLTVAMQTLSANRAFAPLCNTKPFFHTVQSGEPFSFELDVDAHPAPSFQWRRNGVDVPGATSPRLAVAEASRADSGTYTCLVSNAVGKLVWEEGYVSVMDSEPAKKERQPADSERVRQARMCLLRRAPDPVRRSASADGGAAVIAAGESAGYLDCFESLRAVSAERQRQQQTTLDLLRAMHGVSEQRRLLVNVVAALDELAAAKIAGLSVEDLQGRVAFEAGLYCASVPHCAGDASGNARDRVVRLVMDAVIEP